MVGDQSVVSVKQFLLAMPNRYNQSSLEDTQQQQLQQVQTPAVPLPSCSANGIFFDISIKSV